MKNTEHVPSISVKNLVKRYGNFTALNGISFEVNEGEIFGLLGPNGAGKTTTISILSTTINLTSGSASIYDRSVTKNKDDARKLIGIVFQDPSLDEELTGRENLDFHARLYGIKGKEKLDAIERVLELVELEDKADKQVKTYSGGMKRRLEIARGFVHNPKVLFLDEPTIGLDPQTRRKIWEYIVKLNKEEKLTILLTTHYMEEADAICNRIAIIDHGRIIRLDTAERLKDSLGGDVIKVGTADSKKLMALLKKLKMFGSIKKFNNGLEITTKNGSQAIPKIISMAKDAGIDIDYATLSRPTLEDVFISLTGNLIREESASDTDMLKANKEARDNRGKPI